MKVDFIKGDNYSVSLANESFWEVDVHGAFAGILSDYVKPLDIIKELISNSTDHGNATKVTITLKREVVTNQPEGLSLIYHEKADGMNKKQQKRWRRQILKREYEGTGTRSIEKHKGRGSKGVLNSAQFELETVYRDKDETLRKWHVRIEDPHDAIFRQKKPPEVQFIERNTPVSKLEGPDKNRKSTYLKYSIRNLYPGQDIWNDVRPDKLRAYIGYFSKGVDKRVLFNSVRDPGDGKKFERGPVIEINCADIINRYDKATITKFQLTKYHKIKVKTPFEFARAYHPNEEDITAKDTAEGCTKLSKHLGPVRELLVDNSGKTIGHVYISGHVAGEDVLRPYLTRNNSKKSYMGLFLMKDGLPVLLQNPKPWSDGSYSRFQVLAECPQLQTQEGRKGYVEDTIYKTCIETITKTIRKWESSGWYKELKRAKARSKGKKIKIDPPPPEDGKVSPPPLITDEFRLHDNPDMVFGELKYAAENTQEFHEFEPSSEKMLEALAYRLSTEWTDFRYEIIDLRARGQDLIVRNKESGDTEVGEAKLHLKDILSKNRNHQLRACHFLLVWYDDVLDPTNENFDETIVYNKDKQIIRNKYANWQIPVIVLPNEIEKYLRSKKP